MDNHKTRYPIGKHNKQCVGPCYEAGTMVMNPITLEYITDLNNPFCPTDEWEYKDPKTGNKEQMVLDHCYFPTQQKDISDEEISMNIILPRIEFSCTQFLKIYYDISSFEGTMDYIDKYPKTSILTKMRLVECSWKSFKSQLDVVDERLVEFYIEIIKKRWVKKMWNKIKQSIYVKKNGKIEVEENDQGDKQYRVEKINYFIKNYVNKNNVYNILESYIEDNKKRWDDIRSHENEMITYFIDKIF